MSDPITPSESIETRLQRHPEIQYEAGFRGHQFGIWYRIGEHKAFGIIDGPGLDPELTGPPSKYQVNAILTVLNEVKRAEGK